MPRFSMPRVLCSSLPLLPRRTSDSKSMRYSARFVNDGRRQAEVEHEHVPFQGSCGVENVFVWDHSAADASSDSKGFDNFSYWSGDALAKALAEVPGLSNISI